MGSGSCTLLKLLCHLFSKTTVLTTLVKSNFVMQKSNFFLHDTKPERCVAATEGEWRTNGSVTSAQVKHHSLCFFFEGDSPERMT